MTEENKGRLSIHAKKIRMEARRQTLGYILAALGLVAGLAWNEAIKDAIDQFFKSSSDTLTAKFIYAVIVTIVVVLLSMVLIKLKDPEQDNK